MFLGLVACTTDNPGTTSSQILELGISLPYNFQKAPKPILLSNKLQEISGLSVANPRQLYTINDEAGYLFLINQETGAIEQEINFGKKGDYEGVEAANGLVYILKNNGTIYELVLDKTADAIKYETVLNASNDVEGLGYSIVDNQLLLACKGKAGKGDAFKKTKAIYGFDLTSKQLLEEPRLRISEADILTFMKKQTAGLSEASDLSLTQKRLKKFSPSGIAIHPFNGDWYILSSVGKTLFVLDKTGAIKHIQLLDKSIFKQPEGICFDSDGTLFISSEGAGGKAQLFRFTKK